MATFSPNFDTVNLPIPNNPFYWPQGPDNFTFNTPQGPLIFGTGISVDFNTGVISIDPTPPASLGTVTSVTAGPGLKTNPALGITTTGQIQLATVPGLTVGTYTYAAITVDAYGRVTLASNGVPPVQNITGQYPILVTGSSPSITVAIASASITNSGAVQLSNNLSTPSINLALTAQQGYLLQQQIDAITATNALQFLAGTFNASTQQMVTATTAGIGAGITVGSNLPASDSTNVGAVVIVTTAGTYTPPGSSVAVNLVPGDQILSTGSSWVPFFTGFRAPYATTTTAGIVRYATVLETQALADNTIAVTPFGLSGMIASTTQKGFVELATAAETQLLADTTRAVTPAGLGTLQATTTTRGLVQLNDTLTSTSVTEAPTARALKQAWDESIHEDIIQANGDLIVGFAAADPRILPKGIDGQVLTVDITQPLGVKWKTPTAPQSVPVGSIAWFSSNDPAKLPVGWLVADGSSYSDSPADDYYELFQVIGYTYGSSPGAYAVPDLRGQFIRGWDASGGNPANVDPGRAFGSCQGSAFKQHNHSVTDPGHIHAITDPGHVHTVSDPGHSHAITDPGHKHEWNVCTSEVVGDTDSLYDGDGKIGSSSGYTSSCTTGIAISSATTGITVNANFTGITQTLVCTTALTVNNSPTLAPTPNETRPVNVALLPIIKYKNP